MQHPSSTSPARGRTTLAWAFADVLVEAVSRHRPRSGLPRGALVVRVLGEDGAVFTLAWDGARVTLLDGEMATAGIPRAELDVSGEALRRFGGGQDPAGLLAQEGAASVRGERAALADLAACFSPTASLLGVRLRAAPGGAPNPRGRP